MPDKIRLNKYIASSGVYSRRQADDFIISGKVKINGQVVNTPGITVGETDIVEVNGEKIKQTTDKKYVIFNKPPGYITTRSDEEGRKTIYDLFPPELQKLKPAGRLDKDSSGLLILTNDGELIQKLIHPGKKVPKVYLVRVKGKFTQNELLKFKKGIEIEKGKIAYGEGKILSCNKENLTKLRGERNDEVIAASPKKQIPPPLREGQGWEKSLNSNFVVSTVEITLYQGLNRQIRKMFEAVGCSVISLKRTGHACLSVEGLQRGKYRYLAKTEVQDLYNYLKNLK